jgi:hypothetical protein
MGAQFDKLSGAKGYCTYNEVKTGVREMSTAFETAVD